MVELIQTAKELIKINKNFNLKDVNIEELIGLVISEDWISCKDIKNRDHILIEHPKIFETVHSDKLFVEGIALSCLTEIIENPYSGLKGKFMSAIGRQRERYYGIAETERYEAYQEILEPDQIVFPIYRPAFKYKNVSPILKANLN